MRRHSITFLIIILYVEAFAQNQSVSVWVTNSIVLERENETISLSLKELLQNYPDLDSRHLAVFHGKKKLVTQSVDEDFDGSDDVILFQSSFRSKETKQFTIRRDDQQPVQTAALVDGRYVLPREDFAWENDRIAFRIYGSVIAGNVDNGIDVWTKRVRYPIVEKWYHGETQTPIISYHTDHGEGADFFSVGKSLGAGSAGILHNGKLLQGGLFTHYRMITNGPIRVSFEVYYTNWKFDTSEFLEIKKITLDAGEQLNCITEQFISNSSLRDLEIAAGLVKRANAKMNRSAENRRISLWGLTTTDSVNGSLGTAVVFPYSETAKHGEDSVQYLLSTSFNRDRSFTYYSGAAWTRMGDIASESEWLQYLDNFVIIKSNPLIISFQQKK